MIKVSIMYPNEEGQRFDMTYYLKNHMPMIQEKLGDALKGMTVEQGISGGGSGTPPDFIAIGQLFFESLESFQTAFAPHGELFSADVPNYTDIKPRLQISEVLV